MKNNKTAGYIAAAIVLLLAGWAIITYNGLVKKDEKVSLQWNEVQNAYQRRLDLVPNLVNVVKGTADFEQTTLVEVTEARNKAAVTLSDNSLSADNVNAQTAAQNNLAAAANRLIVNVERYPELQGTKAFLGLQTQLERTELRIKIARKDFNTSIAAYNQAVRGFPTKILAGMLGFAPKEGFQADAGADKAQEIKF